MTLGIFDVGCEYLGRSYSEGDNESEFKLGWSFDDESLEVLVGVEMTLREVAEEDNDKK